MQTPQGGTVGRVACKGLLCCALLVHQLELAAAAGIFQEPASAGTHIRTVSWNVAAVNNNPFEYWITHPNPKYQALMQDVERFILDPGAEDVPVHELFTDAMFKRVMSKLEDVKMDELDTVRKLWESEYRNRTIVAQFLKDGKIGKKRLASMPDRLTNTIQLASGESAYRPTVINCYSGELGSLDQWFETWLAFFFNTEVNVGKGDVPVFKLLQKIKRAKYPEVTEEEERASVPLQLVLQGVFDAILVNLMQSKGGNSWQTLRTEICNSLNLRKSHRLLEILKSTYAEADVILLQEAGNQLVDMVQKELTSYMVILPENYDRKRNQNSVILLRKGFFEYPQEVAVPEKGWDNGDLLVVRAVVEGVTLNIASFHGDTNGLLTDPMLHQVHDSLGSQRLIFGMDANTYARESSSTAHALAFERTYTEKGYRSSWGKVDLGRFTTFNARTYLQPQLNKAARSNELKDKGDQNPKDYILFTKHFVATETVRDNTGVGEYQEDTVFPTLEFPSDHAAIATTITLLEGNKSEL